MPSERRVHLLIQIARRPVLRTWEWRRSTKGVQTAPRVENPSAVGRASWRVVDREAPGHVESRPLRGPCQRGRAAEGVQPAEGIELIAGAPVRVHRKSPGDGPVAP